jgi:curli production assembly/transport component CsgG
MVLNIWLQYWVKNYGEHNLNFSDNIDYQRLRDDYYYRFGFGLTYYFLKNGK